MNRKAFLALLWLAVVTGIAGAIFGVLAYFHATSASRTPTQIALYGICVSSKGRMTAPLIHATGRAAPCPWGHFIPVSPQSTKMHAVIIYPSSRHSAHPRRHPSPAAT